MCMLESYGEAKEDAYRLLGVQRRTADAFYLLGYIAEKEGKTTLAVELYREVLRVEPEYLPAVMRLDKIKTGQEEEQKYRTLVEEAFEYAESLCRDVFGEGGTSNKPSGAGGDKSKPAQSDTVMSMGMILSVGKQIPSKNFNDIVGLDTLKERLFEEFILGLNRPDLFERYHKTTSAALLLYGPPGCGKTLLAEALAGELDSSLIRLKLDEVFDMYMGNTEKNIHAVFEEARREASQHKKCVLLIDEFDGLGLNRVGSTHQPIYRAIESQLLVELTNSSNHPGLVILAATNRPWDVDPTLKRSGRLSDPVYIPPPDTDTRIKLLKHYTQGLPSEVEYERIAQLTEDYSAPDIVKLVDKAKTKAILREYNSGQPSALTTQDLLDALSELPKGTLTAWYNDVYSETQTNPAIPRDYPELYHDIAKRVKNHSSPNEQAKHSVKTA